MIIVENTTARGITVCYNRTPGGKGQMIRAKKVLFVPGEAVTLKDEEFALIKGTVYGRSKIDSGELVPVEAPTTSKATNGKKNPIEAPTTSKATNGEKNPK